MKKTTIKLVAALGIGMMIGSAGMAAASSSEVVQATVSKLKLVVDGQVKQTAAPLSYKGTTYVPIRDAAGLFDYDVKFDSAKQQIQFSSKGDTSVTTNVKTETEWIALKKLSEMFDSAVSHKTTLTLTKGEKTVVISGLNWNDEDTISTATTSDGYSIEYKGGNGVTLLNVNQLKEAGIID